MFMGWLWFIPAFHMDSSNKAETTFRLSRQEVDFPLGLGSHIVDVTASLEWCGPSPVDVVDPPPRQSSEDSAQGKSEPTGLGTALDAAAAGKLGDAATVVGDE